VEECIHVVKEDLGIEISGLVVVSVPQSAPALDPRDEVSGQVDRPFRAREGGCLAVALLWGAEVERKEGDCPSANRGFRPPRARDVRDGDQQDW
jgi:hypothetical protein